MPVSKNRKGHKQKAMARKMREKERKAHLENMYKQMMEQLKHKNTSVPEMLNKEEARPPSGPEQTSLGLPPIATSGYLDARTDEERAKDAELLKDAVLTTNVTEDTEPIILSNDN
jgi:hypothetical protein